MSLDTLCQRPIVTIDQGASLRDAARRMREQHVGALVVTAAGPQGSHVVGLVTDRDLVVDGLARALEATAPVGPLASRDLVTVPRSASLGDAAAAMRRAGVRRLLVLAEPDMRLVGLISADDVFEAMAAELGTLAQALRSDITREAQQRTAAPQAEPEPPVFMPAGTPGMPWPAGVGR